MILGVQGPGLGSGLLGTREKRGAGRIRQNGLRENMRLELPCFWDHI